MNKLKPILTNLIMNNLKKIKLIHLRLVVIYSIYIITLSCNTDDIKDTEKKHLHGHVKSTMTKLYEVEDINGEYQKTNMLMYSIYQEPKRSIFDEFPYQLFDESGNIIEEGIYDTDGSFLLKKTYEYTQDGLLSNAFTTRFDGKFITKIYYTYDKQKRVLMERITDYETNNEKELYQYKYDDKSNVICLENYSESNVLESKITMKYNSNNYLVEFKKIDGLNNLDLYFVDSVDNKGNVILRNEIIYPYKGPSFEEITEEENIIKKNVYKFKYEFDAQNNWIKKVIVMNNLPYIIIEREIKYY